MRQPPAQRTTPKPEEQIPAAGVGRWEVVIYHPYGSAEERQVDFAEMVRLAAVHTRFTASPVPTHPA